MDDRGGDGDDRSNDGDDRDARGDDGDNDGDGFNKNLEELNTLIQNNLRLLEQAVQNSSAMIDGDDRDDFNKKLEELNTLIRNNSKILEQALQNSFDMIQKPSKEPKKAVKETADKATNYNETADKATNFRGLEDNLNRINEMQRIVNRLLELKNLRSYYTRPGILESTDKKAKAIPKGTIKKVYPEVMKVVMNRSSKLKQIDKEIKELNDRYEHLKKQSGEALKTSLQQTLVKLPIFFSTITCWK